MTERTKTAEERIVEPARAWQNWFEALIPLSDAVSRPIDPGDKFNDAALYPSKDVAEQKAADVIATHAAMYPGSRAVKFLGAFPEGQRPGE